jgi:hypothetical protein
VVGRLEAPDEGPNAPAAAVLDERIYDRRPGTTSNVPVSEVRVLELSKLGSTSAPRPAARGTRRRCSTDGST